LWPAAGLRDPAQRAVVGRGDSWTQCQLASSGSTRCRSSWSSCASAARAPLTLTWSMVAPFYGVVVDVTLADRGMV